MKSHPRSHYRKDRIVDAPVSPLNLRHLTVAEATSSEEQIAPRTPVDPSIREQDSRRIATINAQRNPGGAWVSDVFRQQEAPTANVPEECPSCGVEVVPSAVSWEHWALLVVEHRRYSNTDRFGVLVPCCSDLCRDVFLDPDPSLRVCPWLRVTFRRGRGENAKLYAHDQIGDYLAGAERMTKAAHLIRADRTDTSVFFTFEEARAAIEENERLRQERDDAVAEAERLRQERDDAPCSRHSSARDLSAFEEAAEALFLRMIGETKSMQPFDDFMDNVVVEHDDEWTIPEGAEPWIAFLPKSFGGPFEEGASPVETYAASPLAVARGEAAADIETLAAADDDDRQTIPAHNDQEVPAR